MNGQLLCLFLSEERPVIFYSHHSNHGTDIEFNLTAILIEYTKDIRYNIARARKILQELGDDCSIFLASAIIYSQCQYYPPR